MLLVRQSSNIFSGLPCPPRTQCIANRCHGFIVLALVRASFELHRADVDPFGFGTAAVADRRPIDHHLVPTWQTFCHVVDLGWNSGLASILRRPAVHSTAGFTDCFAPNILWKEAAISEGAKELIATAGLGQDGHGTFSPCNLDEDHI